MTIVRQIRCDTCRIAYDITPYNQGDCLHMYADGVTPLGELRHICISCQEKREKEQWDRFKSEIIQQLSGQRG
jgi:hypothetical protein